MSTYESKVKSIPAAQEAVFERFSNLESLKPLLEKIQDERIKEVRVDADSVYCSVEGFGGIGMRIIEREPYKTIKFEGDQSPLAFNIWIQLVGVADNDTRMKLTLKADIPIFIKPMIDSKLEEGIEVVAEMLAKAAL